MVLGILSSASQAETCLNNLYEADFKLSKVSLVMKDIKARNALAKDTGPLRGTNPANIRDRLVRLGLNDQAIQEYVGAVSEGKILIAINCPPESQAAALEMLRDYKADGARLVPSKDGK